MNLASLEYSSTSPAVQSGACTVLIVPGLYGSCERHWQSAWERERSDCRRVQMESWADPQPEAWIDRLDSAVNAQPGPVIIAAHSLGCIATALWAVQAPRELRRKVRGALLVAPCDPEKINAPRALRRFAPVPQLPLGVRTIVVASSNDEYATLERSRTFAYQWNADFVNLGALGHINAASQLGSWTYGQSLLNVFKQHLPYIPH